MKATESRHLCNLPWRRHGNPKRGEVVLVKGDSGYKPPYDEIVMLAYYDGERHPNAVDHWYSTTHDLLRDYGFIVTHWCDLWK